jgi:GT2 family glycosyltransferase
MSLSVAIVTKDRAQDLLDCLNSITESRDYVDEIILVENNKKKTLSTLIKKFTALPIRYYLQPLPGIAHTRNLAVQKATKNIVAFIDDDCIVDGKWAKHIKKFFLRNPKANGLLGRSLNYYTHSTIAKAEQLQYELWFNQFFKVNDQQNLSSGVFINTRNFAIKRSIIKQHKLIFNPKAPRKIEDTDFGLRLFQVAKNNTSIVYTPDVKIYHKNSRTLMSYFTRLFLTGRGTQYLHGRYGQFEPQKVHSIASTQTHQYSKMVRLLLFLGRRVSRFGYYTQAVMSL